MSDRIMNAFLRRQHEDGMALAARSDLLTLIPLEGDPPQRWIAEFRCTGLVREPSGVITEAARFAIGIWFPDDYLRRADPFQVLTWLVPRNVWHPNVGHQMPFVCVGRLAAGTSLVDILYRLFEIVSYQRVTMREDDALNREACVWSRANLRRFPVDRRSLVRRPEATPVEEESPWDFDIEVLP